MAEIKILDSLVHKDLDVANKEDALKIMVDELENQSLVTSDFYVNLLKREEKDPTGLDTGAQGFAIPHTEPEYVKVDSLSVAVLRKPVKFRNMVDQSKEIDVKVIFLFALSGETQHLNILQQIMQLITEDSMLDKMDAFTKEESIKYLRGKLNTK